jgi:hypothetical protein
LIRWTSPGKQTGPLAKRGDIPKIRKSRRFFQWRCCGHSIKRRNHMTIRMPSLAAMTSFAVGVALYANAASAAPVYGATAMKAAVPANVESVRWGGWGGRGWGWGGRGWGWGIGGGLLAGALIGGALASPYYGYGYPYYGYGYGYPYYGGYGYRYPYYGYYRRGWW